MYFTRKLHILFSEKNAKSLKVCDCFFNVAVYCKMVESLYREFVNLCMNEKHDSKTSFAIIRKETCFIACCKDFLKAMIKKKGLNKIKSMLASNCFYSSGIDSGFEDDMMSCINTNFNEQNFDYFCFYCQRNISDSFSNELHYVTLS